MFDGSSRQRSGMVFQRKNRKGAFWEDCYHATIVQTNRHLLSCMTYIDLNMVRAGVVDYPSEWAECGYNEILNQPRRYSLIDRKRLKTILGVADGEDLFDAYQMAVADEMQNKEQSRLPMWIESIAVGDEVFVNETKRKLSSMGIGRTIIPGKSAHQLREPVSHHFLTAPILMPKTAL